MSEDRHNDRLKDWGLKATWIYLIVLFGGLPPAIMMGAIEIQAIRLNELGDFLAGAFGPLAFFWLVLGFLQQSRELQNSVDALNLQAKELSSSAKQQAEMVKVTRESLEHERKMMETHEIKRKQAIQPGYLIRFGALSKQGNDKFKYSLKVENTGMAAIQFSLIVTLDGVTFLQIASDHFKNGDVKDVKHDQLFGKQSGDFRGLIKYTDIEGESYSLKYVFDNTDPLNEWPRYEARLIASE